MPLLGKITATGRRPETLETDANSPVDVEELLEAGVRLPEHVVYRSFAAQTVVLNLKSARYHGLNPIAAEMLTQLTQAKTVGEAVEQVAEHYRQDRAVVENDVLKLTRDLLQRGLLERVS